MYRYEFTTEGSGDFLIDVAGETLGKHALVYRSNAQTWLLADADTVATMPVTGLTLEPISSGLRGTILLKGYVADTAWTWTTGGDNGRIYASTTPGALTQIAPTPPDTRQVIAVAFFPTGIWFDPSGLGAGQNDAVEGSQFVIDTDGNYVWAKSGSTGEIVYGGPANAGGIIGTDDTAVWQAAINAMTLGGKLLVKEGNYSTTQITIPDGVRNWGITIEGEAIARPNVTHTGTNEAWIAVENPLNNYFYIEIKNFRVSASATTGAFPLIDYTAIYRSYIGNMRLVGSGKTNTGVRLGGYFNTVSHVIAETLATGFQSSTNANANQYIDCLARDCDVGFDIDGDTNRLVNPNISLCDSIGIRMRANADVCNVFGMRIEDDAATITGVQLDAGCNRAIFFGGSIASVSTLVVNNGTNARFVYVNGYPTRITGTATILNGTAAVTLAHGCITTPTSIRVSGTHTEVDRLYVTAVGGANFTINAGAGNVTANRDVYWEANLDPA